MAKRYYWLKLKDDFFEDKTTKILRSMPGGDNLVIIYLKMQLKSLKTEGILQYTKILPSNVEELSVLLDEDVNNIRLLLETLKRLNCIEELEDGSLYMLAMQDLVGSESSWAQYKRKGNASLQELKYCKRLSYEQILLPTGKVQFVDEKRYGGNGAFALDRAKGKCELCGSTENIVIHHNNKFSNDLNDLLVLCRKCHRKVENEKLENFQSVSKKLPTDIDIEKDIEIEKEKNIAEIAKCYEQNIGVMNPAAAELIFSYLDDFQKDMIIQAIKIASQKNKKNASYINGILRDWKNKGYKVLADVNQENSSKSTKSLIDEIWEEQDG